MKNLKHVDGARLNAKKELQQCQILSVDYDTKVVYCGTSIAIYVIDPASKEVRFGVSLTQDGYAPADGSGKLVGLQHMADQMALCAATASGHVLLWSLGSDKVECMGSVESGLQAMAWSPDHEILVLVTGANTIVLMTRDFDPITEVAMHPSEFGEAAFITVGWGKKETQFHGSEGKQAASRKAQTVKPTSPWDDQAPRVSWRGDGQYFVVSSVHPGTGARVLHTWTRECTLHSTSEAADGIEQCLAWRPSGSVIATSQRRPNKYDIAFFERNGLRHGEFTLPFKVKEVKVKELYWNSGSSVLCVWLEELPPEGGTDEELLPKSWVQLWTVGNYHWYLKQSLAFAATAEDKVAAVCWDPEQEYTLHIVCNGGQYLQYRWTWSTDCSHSNAPTNDTPVAVIDGDNVLVTPFKRMVVPPPMSAYNLQLPCPVNHVAFSSQSGNDLLAVLSDERLALFSYEEGNKGKSENVKLSACGGTGFDVMCQIPTFKGYFTLNGFDADSYPLRYNHFLWNETHVIICTLSPDNESLIYVCDVAMDTRHISARATVETYSRVFALARGEESHTVAVQMTDGSLFKLDLDCCELSPWCDAQGEHVVFAQPCSQMAVCTLGDQEVVIGLTERFRLYVNKLQLATNCTSFAIHEEFLLLTSHAHTIRCICRTTKLSALSSLAEGKAHPFDETVRRVERGSRLVCVVRDSTSVVLQMPRGNLETLHPRALVLSAVRKHLDRVQFKEAFTLMRKHRINMNLIYDHSPATFIHNVRQFITQIDSVTHINLFLTDLVEEDVTRSMYTAAYNRDVTPVAGEAEQRASKVDAVCDAVNDALRQMDREKYLLSILTAHVRKSTPELDVALNIVKDLKGRGNKGQSAAEEALKYLLFLVDVNELYDVALGTYDFQLVLMVAEKSQKDPKEYLPFLNNLRKLEPEYQQYTIDKHLKRYHSALEHISKAGKEHFEECLSLVKDQRLYSHALMIFPHGSESYQKTAQAYGDYLHEKKHHDEAGLLYMKAEQYEQALAAYTCSANWRQCLCMASKLGHGADRISELSRNLAATLKERRKYIESACLLELYANDVEEAIVTLIDGHEWDEALRMMHKHKRLDFIETNLKPGLEECCEAQLELLTEQRALFDRHRARLDVVRVEKEKKRLEILEHGEGVRGDSDLFSDTSSATGDSVISDGSQRSKSSRKSGSVFTRVSGRSGKAKRKGEKKRWTLKEGSAKEDCALIEALANIIKQVNTVRDDIAPLLQTLVMYNYENKARELQARYESFLSLIQTHVADIWDPEQNHFSSALPTSAFGPDSTANTIALAMQQGLRTPATEDTTIDPVLRVAPTLNKDTSWKLNILECRDKR